MYVFPTVPSGTDFPATTAGELEPSTIRRIQFSINEWRNFQRPFDTLSLVLRISGKAGRNTYIPLLDVIVFRQLLFLLLSTTLG